MEECNHRNIIINELAQSVSYSVLCHGAKALNRFNPDMCAAYCDVHAQALTDIILLHVNWPESIKCTGRVKFSKSVVFSFHTPLTIHSELSFSPRSIYKYNLTHAA